MRRENDPRAGRTRPRYRFGEFTVSPGRRLLLRAGREVPLIPRYFDLLVLLLERREEAVHRRDILDAVWSDVVVSDGALSQAVRTLRRALGDTSREPGYIKTVARHGYRFVHPGVIEDSDEARLEVETPVPSPTTSPPEAAAAAPPAAPGGSAAQAATPAAPGGLEATPDDSTGPAAPADPDGPFESALARLLDPAPDPDAAAEDLRREAAETLHLLGTEEALRRLDRRPGHEAARALLRDARWDVPGAGPVPLLGRPGALGATRALVALRLRRAARLAAGRWAAASEGGAAAGAVAGLLGGLLLLAAPGSETPASLPVALAIVGAIVGGIGAAGIGAGLAAAEALARSLRGPALVLCGAAGGGLIGAAANLVGRWTLEGIFGHDLSEVGGGFEGIFLGTAVGLGYAVSTPRPGGGGMATPRGKARLLAALAAGACCAAAGVLASRFGGHLVAASLNVMARSYPGSQVELGPIYRLLGEYEFGSLTRAAMGGVEGFFFGSGMILGLTRRPR